jgi:hypothetical protein
VAAIPIPPGATCRGRARAVNGVLGLPDGVIPGWTNMLLDPATNDVVRTFETGGEWFDFVVVDESAWFVQHGRGGDPTVALVELDTASGRPARVLTMPGRLHQNTTFESEALVVAHDYLWVLADGGSAEAAAVRPEVMRIPLRELRKGQ